MLGLLFTWDIMHVLQMAAKVSALSECFDADRALVGPCTRVLTEVISQVAALLEYAFAVLKAALEIQFGFVRD